MFSDIEKMQGCSGLVWQGTKKLNGRIIRYMHFVALALEERSLVPQQGPHNKEYAHFRAEVFL